MGRTACTEPQCLYKGAFYLFFTPLGSLFYITAIVDQYAVTVTLNRPVHAVNLRAVLETQFGGIAVLLR